MQAGVGAEGFSCSASPLRRCCWPSSAVRPLRRRRTTTSRTRRCSHREQRDCLRIERRRNAPGGRARPRRRSRRPFDLVQPAGSGRGALRDHRERARRQRDPRRLHRFRAWVASPRTSSNDNGGPSRVCVAAPSATTFWIAIDGYGGATGSDISLSWDRYNGGSPCPNSTPSITGGQFPWSAMSSRASTHPGSVAP